MQTARDHQVPHQPEIALDANRNSLAGSPQPLHGFAEGVLKRRIDGAQQKRTHDADRFQLPPENALL